MLQTFASEDSFLSSNTQDFIEVTEGYAVVNGKLKFLSSNTQDFIEVNKTTINNKGRI